MALRRAGLRIDNLRNAMTYTTNVAYLEGKNGKDGAPLTVSAASMDWDDATGVWSGDSGAVHLAVDTLTHARTCWLGVLFRWADVPSNPNTDVGIIEIVGMLLVTKEALPELKAAHVNDKLHLALSSDEKEVFAFTVSKDEVRTRLTKGVKWSLACNWQRHSGAEKPFRDAVLRCLHDALQANRATASAKAAPPPAAPDPSKLYIGGALTSPAAAALRRRALRCGRA